MPIPTITLLPPIVVSHPDIVPDHVSHGAGQKMRLVRVDIDADSDSFRPANGSRRRHTSLPTDEYLTRKKLRRILIDLEHLPRQVRIEIRQGFADILVAIDLGLVAALPRFDVDHRDSGVQRAEVEIGDVGHLDGIVDDFRSRTAVPLLEHGLVDDEGGFYVFGRFPDVSAKAVAIQRWEETGMGFRPPVHVSGICTAFVCFGARLKYHVRMFLLKKNEKAVQSHGVHKFGGGMGIVR